MRYCIYGARAFSISAYVAMRSLYPDRIIDCFLVTDAADNPEEIDSLPVLEAVAYAATLSDDARAQTEIIIAAAAHLHHEITDYIESLGFLNHSALDEETWGTLMEDYYRAQGTLTLLCDLDDADAADDTDTPDIRPDTFRIYMARHVKDKGLQQPVSLPSWMIPVQAGAALTKERIAEVTDDTGENISVKNVNYCELTALYWAWKNRHDAFYGLAHYRRFMEFDERDLRRIAAHDIDVVCPMPFTYHRGMEIHHHQFVKDADYAALLQALNEKGGSKAALLDEVLAQPQIYLYNIMAARSEVMDDYCRWLFPILERTEELSDPKGSDRADRYIGYMGETLLTLYLYSRRNELRVAHTRLRFLV